MARFEWRIEEFQKIRKSQGMKDVLAEIGQETVTRCNASLRAAQAARKQPQEDGYDFTVVEGATRARLFINATTARAMAHEAVNQDILKNLPIGEVKNRRPPDHEVPKELARRSDAAQNLDGQGNRIHRLDT